MTPNAVKQKMVRMFRSSGPVPVPPSVWTVPGNTEKMVRMWAEGLSASLIAQEFGITRNAVIGKADRLQLPPRRTVAAQSRAPKHRARDGSTMYNIKRRSATPRPPRPYVERKPPPMPIEPLNIPFMDLTPFMCREVIGKGDYGLSISCGHPVHQRSFCEWHYSRNYEKPRDDKRLYRFAA